MYNNYYAIKTSTQYIVAEKGKTNDFYYSETGNET